MNAFGRKTRPTTVKNHCTAASRGRGVLGEFGLCQVSGCTFFFYVPYADWVMCGGSIVPVAFESSRRRVARHSQSLLVEGIVLWMQMSASAHG